MELRKMLNGRRFPTSGTNHRSRARSLSLSLDIRKAVSEPPPNLQRDRGLIFFRTRNSWTNRKSRDIGIQTLCDPNDVGGSRGGRRRESNKRYIHNPLE